MATLADRLKTTVYRARAIAGAAGFRDHSATIIIAHWTAAQAGAGTRYTTEIPIVEARGQNPRIRWLSDEEIAVGGYAAKSVVEIGAITPPFAGGGTDLTPLNEMSTRDTAKVILRGPRHPNGASYRIGQLSFKPLRNMIRAALIDEGTDG